MDTDRLRYFSTVAETGSLTKAAELLGISHSGLSKAISTLETELGFELFQPQGRGLEITQDGKWFYQKAKEILKIADEIARGRDERPTTTKIGLSEVIALTCAGAIAAELKTPLSLLEVDIGNLEGKIVEGELDFGLAFVPSPRPELAYLEIGRIKFNAFARADLLEKTDLEDLPYIVPASEFPFNPLGYKSRDGWPAAIQRRPYFSVGGFAIALNLLREGQGAVYMPNFVMLRENAEAPHRKIVKIKAHAEAESARQIYLVKSRAKPESKEMKKVSKIIRQICCG